MKRINIIGTSGSGKSTFGKSLAEKLGCRYLEMDDIYWLPEWQQPSDTEFFTKLRKELVGDSWVLDGNYNRTVPIKWQDVDVVIWLDYSFLRTLTQVVHRTFKRCITREELWKGTGNFETFSKALFSKDSIILWMITNHAKNRKRYEAVMKKAEFQHIQFVRLRSPKHANDYLKAVKRI